MNRRTTGTRRVLAGLVAAGLAVTLAGCVSAQDGPDDVLAAMQAREQAAAEAAAAPPAAAAPAAAAAATCTPGAEVSFQPLGSVPPAGRMPAGTLEAVIAKRGYLVVGVSGDTRLLGARDSLAGGELKGFDIEVAKAVATAIFGESEGRVRFQVITAAQRVPFVTNGVENGGVDMVARAMTMNCDRWNQVAFSAVYFEADQIMLVRNDSKARTAKELAAAKARVCAPKGSTSLDALKAWPGIVPVAVDIHSDCLALWQEGRVEAITGDDAILAGFADQDPRAVLGKEKLGAQPYGLAISQKHPEFARFVNAVLASPAGRAAWTKAYSDSGLAPRLGPKPQPAPQYGR